MAASEKAEVLARTTCIILVFCFLDPLYVLLTVRKDNLPGGTGTREKAFNSTTPTGGV